MYSIDSEIIYVPDIILNALTFKFCRISTALILAYEPTVKTSQPYTLGHSFSSMTEI